MSVLSNEVLHIYNRVRLKKYNYKLNNRGGGSLKQGCSGLRLKFSQMLKGNIFFFSKCVSSKPVRYKLVFGLK